MNYDSMCDELEKIAKAKVVKAGGSRFRFTSQPGSLQITKEGAPVGASLGRLLGGTGRLIKGTPQAAGSFGRSVRRQVSSFRRGVSQAYRGHKPATGPLLGSKTPMFRKGKRVGPSNLPVPVSQKGKPATKAEKGKGGLSWGKAGLIGGGLALGGAGIGAGHLAGRFYDAQTAPPYAPYRNQ
jgi:hypothetical protein